MKIRPIIKSDWTAIAEKIAKNSFRADISNENENCRKFFQIDESHFAICVCAVEWGGKSEEISQDRSRFIWVYWNDAKYAIN